MQDVIVAAFWTAMVSLNVILVHCFITAYTHDRFVHMTVKGGVNVRL
jgi:hypothetical protein